MAASEVERQAGGGQVTGDNDARAKGECVTRDAEGTAYGGVRKPPGNNRQFVGLFGLRGVGRR